jgi:4,5-DOPA dioxygenase extradiol
LIIVVSSKNDKIPNVNIISRTLMKKQHNKPLFIGHGSPMNALSNNAYTQFLSAYAKSIQKPAAIVVISAHWQTAGSCITGGTAPEQIYDFYGFPEELYQVKYTPPGSEDLAEKIEQAEIGITIDKNRGIDHAAWAVLKHMYPDQDVPVLEISLDDNKSLEEHVELGTKLSEFRDDGILFIGSGNVVHNLHEISFEQAAKPFTWAATADRWLKEKIENHDMNELLQYERYLPGYQRAVPTNEHYLPLLYILGMKKPAETATTIYDEIQNGSISMRSIEIV